VFVHGLTGSALNTWLDPNTGVHWPSTLLHEEIPDARILAFGYDADVMGFWNPASQNCIGNHAENLLGDLVRIRDESDSVSFCYDEAFYDNDVGDREKGNHICCA